MSFLCFLRIAIVSVVVASSAVMIVGVCSSGIQFSLDVKPPHAEGLGRMLDDGAGGQ